MSSVKGGIITLTVVREGKTKVLRTIIEDSVE